MNLKEAREIARKVGATIEERRAGSTEPEIIVRFGVVKIGPNGTREQAMAYASDYREAAELAVVETGRLARALLEQSKKVYVDSDLIFGAPKV